MLVGGLALLLAMLADLAICAGIQLGRRRSWSYWRWLYPGLILIWLAVPAVAGVVVAALRTTDTGTTVGFLSLLVGIPISLRFGGNGLSREESRDATRRRRQTQRLWQSLDRPQRHDVRKLAKADRLHPDAYVAALAVQWASETLANGHGRVGLAKQIMTAADHEGVCCTDR